MQRRYRYYDLLLAAFVVVLLCSNFIGAGKVATLDLPVFGAGILDVRLPAIPLTNAVVGFLKKKENEDYYDTHTNFTPFKIKV